MNEFKWTDELALEYAEEYRFSSGRITIEQFKKDKEKPVLFVSEDGIKIYKGDKYYYVSEDWKAFEYTANGSIRDGSHSFKEKENAEHFILMNARMLSINDMKGYIINDPESKYLELVRSRLFQNE